MNIKVRRILSVLMTMVVTVGMLHVASEVLERKESDFKYRDFFAQKEDFDVLFLGSSHVINGVYPYELWDDYGMVTYNLGAHGAPPAISYWVLMNSLKSTTPKLVVLDCLYASWETRVPPDFEQLHEPFDAFPLTITKMNMVNDMMEGIDDHSKAELIWDFTTYHNRWNQFEPWDFTLPYNEEMGGETRIDLATPLSFESTGDDIQASSDTVSAEYVRRTIERCQADNIDVLLVYMPFPASDDRRAEAEMINVIAEEYGVNYINFLDKDVVNYETDMYDEDSHLNPSGAKKVTNYIGQFIRDNYDVPNHKDGKTYINWEEGWERYKSKKLSDFMYETSPYIYMVLMADNDLDIDMELYNSEIYKDELFKKLNDNLNYTSETSAVNPYDYDVDMRLTVKDKKTGDIIEKSLFNYYISDDGSSTIELSRDYNW